MVRTRVVSYSELDAIRQCRMKHRLGFIERWRPGEEAETLSRGRRFHEVMERHYRIIQHVQQGGTVQDEEAVELKWQMRSLTADPETAAQTPEQELVEWMYRGYVANFGADEDWRVVAVEHPIEEWLPTPRGTRSSFRLKGKIDLIVRDASAGGGLWIVDHKTCRDLPKGREIDLDDQFAIYEWLLRKRGNDIRGIIYNAVRTTRLKSREMAPDERFKRSYTVRTEQELRTVVGEAYEHFREAYRGVTQVDPSAIDPEGSIGGSINPPRSPNTDLCRWRCSYTEACLAGRKGADMRGLLSSTGYIQDFERH